MDGGVEVRHVLPQGEVRVSYRGAPCLQANSLTCFDVALCAGMALPAGARFALARRWPSDWGLPQWTDARSENHMRVDAPDGVGLQLALARRHTWHPFDHVMEIELCQPLPAGARLQASFGASGEGSAGFRVQTFIEEASPLSIRLLPAPGATWVEIARPVVRIVGAAPSLLVLTAPARVQAGRAFELHLRAQDIWGNPATLDAPLPVCLAGPDGVEARVAIPLEGWCRTRLSIGSAGIHRVTARTEGDDRFEATSNPVEVSDDAPVAQLVWGDLHAQSVIGCGVRSIADYFRHARDFAATDFSSHQANCFLVSGDEWEETQRVTQAFNEAGRFVTLLGVEWSAAARLGGDHNLYFPGDRAELRRCSHQYVADKSDLHTDLPHVDDLHAHYRGTDTLVALHVGGRTADLQFHAPALDRLLEVHSTHATSEWFLFEALRRGYRMGVVAGSDSVDGRSGASHPGRMGVRNLRGGLTAVEVPELTRGALWEALKAKRCYATTGERILLSFTAGDHRMGDEASLRLAAGDNLPAFDVRVAGTAAIEAIEFFRDDVLLRHHDVLGAVSGVSERVRVAWRGASAPGNWEKARMVWDGELVVEGARILDAVPWAFDTPSQGFTHQGPQRVAWHSTTAGDWDGVVLTLDRADAATLRFHSVPLTLQIPIGDVGPAGWQHELQEPWRALEIRRLPPRDPPSTLRHAFHDPEPLPGWHAYWVRVRQVDGAYAWSTPIYLQLDID